MADRVEILLKAPSGTSDLYSTTRIALIALNQRFTYAGLVEGLPTKRMNRQIIEGAIREARKCFFKSEPYVIWPCEEPIDFGDEYPLGEPARLPTMLCIGCFESSSPARKSTADYSALTVVWFQQHFAMPIDSDVVEHLRTIDWPAIATDLTI